MSEKAEYQAMKEREGILLNANESSINLPFAIRKEIAEKIMEIDFHRYPEDEASELCAAYAEYVGVGADQVIAGNGSDEMLGLLIAMFIHKGEKLYTLTPDFSMYDYYVSMHEGEIVRFPREPKAAFDVDAFIAKGKEENIKMVLFSNPNNPTGQIIAKKDLCRIVEAFDCPVVIDEAYGEFMGDTMVDQLDRYENLYVTRTLSKVFAFAAGRCGFLIANKKAMQQLRPHKVPYNVNSMTQCAALAVLAHKEELLSQCELIKQEREQMIKECLELNGDRLTLYPSYANFLYGRSPQKQQLLEMFEQQGITIRNYADDTFRITVGTPKENQKVLNILHAFEEGTK